MAGVYPLAHRLAYAPHAKLGNTQIYEQQEERKASGQVRMLTILVCFLALLTIASIIISVVAMLQWGKPAERDGRHHHYDNDGRPAYPYNHDGGDIVVTNTVSGGDDSHSAGGDRVYVVAFGEEWNQHELIDSTEGGQLKGWGIQILLAACEAAGIKCQATIMPYSECINYFNKEDYNKHPLLGGGLASGAIDGCGGWFKDIERSNLATYSTAWIRNPKVWLWYPSSSSNPIGNNPRIGFNYATPWNEKCLIPYLTRKGVSYSSIVPYNGDGAVYNGLKNEEVELAFLSDLNANVPGGWEDLTGVDVDDPVTCGTAGGGVVAHKKNQAFVDKLTLGINTIRSNGVMRSICDAIPAGTPDQFGQWCVDTYSGPAPPVAT